MPLHTVTKHILSGGLGEIRAVGTSASQAWAVAEDVHLSSRGLYMLTSQAIADFSGALDAARVELASLDVKIQEVEHERHCVANAAPHTDDIVQVFMRGLERNEREFTRQLASRLEDSFAGEGSAACAARGRAMDILTLEAEKPDRQAVLTRSLRGDAVGPDLNITILTYFLRDRIAAEIPALVNKLCPASREGLKQADRELALQRLDAELGRLKEQRAALHADLLAARAAVVR